LRQIAPENRVAIIGAVPTVNIHLDKTVIETTRFAVLVFLAHRGGRAGYVETRDYLALPAPGALSVHARVLENAGLIMRLKSGKGFTSKTDFMLTPEGYRALAHWRGALNQLVIPEIAKEAAADGPGNE
jgi:Winged helix DNA-binding domain